MPAITLTKDPWMRMALRAALPMLLFFILWAPILLGPERVKVVTDNVPHISFERPKRSAFDETKVALLVEGRPLPHLAPIMLHFMSVVPPEWRFKFLGTPESVKQLNRSVAVRNQVLDGKLDIELLPDNLSFDGPEGTSLTFTNLGFYRDTLAPAEHLLVFQTDSMLCANSLENLNDWIQYDWVGASWSLESTYGGNGGLSIRRVSKIIKVLEKEKRKPQSEPEDVWLTYRMNQLPGANMANGSISNTFSSENFYWHHPMGYHTGMGGNWLGAAIWGSPERRKELFDWCPEIKMWGKMDIASAINTEACPKRGRWD